MPDQFGGEKVRKLKMSGFNELLDKLSVKLLWMTQYEVASDFLKTLEGR